MRNKYALEPELAQGLGDDGGVDLLVADAIDELVLGIGLDEGGPLLEEAPCIRGQAGLELGEAGGDLVVRGAPSSASACAPSSVRECMCTMQAPSAATPALASATSAGP